MSATKPRKWDEHGRLPTRGAAMTHDEVAKALNLSRQRIEQLERSALKKLAKSKVLRELAK